MCHKWLSSKLPSIQVLRQPIRGVLDCTDSTDAGAGVNILHNRGKPFQNAHFPKQIMHKSQHLTIVIAKLSLNFNYILG